MRKITIVGLAVVLLTSAVWARPARFIIDDDEYVAKVIEAGTNLLQAGRLVSVDALRRQVHDKGFRLKLCARYRQRLDTPDLYERLRESTLAVGTLYKCPDCGAWEFNSSTGFVVGQGGVICTCCHVIAEDPEVKNGYLIAADSTGQVFPVRSVLAADTDSDTCFLKLDASGLKPLPLRAGARAGERVYCMSHPGGYFFMFTQGLVARVNRRVSEAVDEYGRTNGLLTRPVLFLNVTAEFAPGSSGAPVVDEAGNVLGQVASITDAGEPSPGDTNNAPSPSVPVRFCTATEEMLRLTDTSFEEAVGLRRLPAASNVALPTPETPKPPGPAKAPLGARSPAKE